MFKSNILDSKGQPIILNAMEYQNAQYIQEQMGKRALKNSVGFEVNITTLTAIAKRVVEQKFFTFAPADYFPVRVGENAWSSNIITYRDYQVMGDFESGIINTASNDSRLAQANAAIDTVTVPVINWAAEISYSVPDLQMSARAGNWDLVTSKERARKRMWDLGIQRVAFVGLETAAINNVYGLLTQPDVTANTTLLSNYINTLTDANYQTFVASVLEAYRSNAQRTVYPTHFIVPEAEWNGLMTPVNTNFAIKSKLEYLLDAFKVVTMNPNFKILPNAYCDEANNAAYSSLDKNRYVLLNYDEDSVRMDIPVDYNNTLQNSLNNFQFQSVGYGQFTGARAYRPREMLYIDWAS